MFVTNINLWQTECLPGNKDMWNPTKVFDNKLSTLIGTLLHLIPYSSVLKCTVDYCTISKALPTYQAHQICSLKDSVANIQIAFFRCNLSINFYENELYNKFFITVVHKYILKSNCFYVCFYFIQTVS